MRNRHVKVRVSEEEKSQLATLAHAHGLTVSEYLRRGYVLPPQPSPHREIVGELARIGNNLNQIARRVNGGDIGAACELASVTQAFKVLRERLS